MQILLAWFSSTQILNQLAQSIRAEIIGPLVGVGAIENANKLVVPELTVCIDKYRTKV